jgi:hypothetical protein
MWTTRCETAVCNRQQGSFMHPAPIPVSNPPRRNRSNKHRNGVNTERSRHLQYAQAEATRGSERRCFEARETQIISALPNSLHICRSYPNKLLQQAIAPDKRDQSRSTKILSLVWPSCPSWARRTVCEKSTAGEQRLSNNPLKMPRTFP